MNNLLSAPTGHPIIDNIQYIVVLAMLIGLLVVGLAALVHCRVLWLHRWLSLGWFSDLVLTKDPRQKTICLRFLVGAVNCIVGVAALNYGVSIGAIKPGHTSALTILACSVTLSFYAVIRSGTNLRLADPTMVSYQMATAIFFLAWGYLLGGVGRPIALMLLFIILMFGMFATNIRTLVRASILAAVLFGSVMAYVAVAEANQPWEQKLQLVYFCVLLTMLISASLLMSQLTRMRIKLSDRKKELTLALQRIQELATRDDLTGLYNRRHMLELLNTEKHRAIRSERGFCIALLDLDHFKNVNDTHGHGVGDETLMAAATAITSGLRETDIVARWGGEEFLILFTDTDCGTAEAVLQRIQLSFKTTLMSQGVPDLRLSFSAGLTSYESDELLTRTIDRADQALYQAKAAGRSRIVRIETRPPGSGPLKAPKADQQDTSTTDATARSSSFKYGHAFNVRRVREHIDRARRHAAVASLVNQQARIARQCRRVAADIHDALRGLPARCESWVLMHIGHGLG